MRLLNGFANKLTTRMFFILLLYRMVMLQEIGILTKRLTSLKMDIRQILQDYFWISINSWTVEIDNFVQELVLTRKSIFFLSASFEYHKSITFASVRVIRTSKAMQPTAIRMVDNSLPENDVILLTLLISKRYIPYTDLHKICVKDF